MNTALAIAHALHLDPSAVALAWLVFRVELLTRSVRADRARTHKRIKELEKQAGLAPVAGTA